MRDSYIVWKGPSAFNGEPILLALTGIARPSSNRKTGPVIQAYILREGIKPTEYRKQGAKAICGNCPLKSACYVGNHYLNQVYDGSQRGIDVLPKALLRGRVLRLGAYGDPGMIPYEVWDGLLKWTAGWTGYCHQWRWCDPRFRKLCLASVKNPAEMKQAWKLGWKTYRVGLAEEEPTQDELYCPYYTWQHQPQIQCLQCQLCRGDNLPGKKGIFVHVHGTAEAKNNFRRIREEENGGPDYPQSA